MTEENSFDPKVYLELMQTIAGIPVRDEWKAGVASHLATAARMAEIVEAAELDPDTIDLAGVFEAGIPGEAPT